MRLSNSYKLKKYLLKYCWYAFHAYLRFFHEFYGWILMIGFPVGIQKKSFKSIYKSSFKWPIPKVEANNWEKPVEVIAAKVQKCRPWRNYTPLFAYTFVKAPRGVCWHLSEFYLCCRPAVRFVLFQTLQITRFFAKVFLCLLLAGKLFRFHLLQTFTYHLLK